MKNKHTLSCRRSFFKKMAVLGGGLLLARLSGAAGAPGRTDGAPSKQGAGYRLTKHIRKYYETAAR